MPVARGRGCASTRATPPKHAARTRRSAWGSRADLSLCYCRSAQFEHDGGRGGRAAHGRCSWATARSWRRRPGGGARRRFVIWDAVRRSEVAHGGGAVESQAWPPRRRPATARWRRRAEQRSARFALRGDRGAAEAEPRAARCGCQQRLAATRAGAGLRSQRGAQARGTGGTCARVEACD